jgi:von Willebrand factor A domain-containing protein 5
MGGTLRLIPIENPSLVIPLKNINIKVKIQENIARVEIEQEYYNDSPYNYDCDYYFPISESSVFDSFEAKTGNKTVKGQIKEKEQAREEFTRAVSEGRTAALSEITKTKDIMKVNIGNFLSGDMLSLKYSYIEMLDVAQSKFWRLIVFSTLTPLYSPLNFTSPPIVTVRPDDKTYKWNIQTEISTRYPISELRVPSHEENVLIKYSDDKKKAMITMSPDKEYNPNKNYEVYYSTEGDHIPTLVVERYINESSLLNVTNSANSINVQDDLLGYISFFPKFNVTSLERNMTQISPQEFIFIADRSGSMSGDRILKLKSSLVRILNTLPDNSYFNIISFGSSFKPMYEKTQSTAELRADAIARVEKFDADMGGTEILQAVKYALDLPYVYNYPRIIMLLTDGDVSNPDQVIDIVRRSKNKARVNSIGIGSGASNYLIKGVARAGDGKYEFITDNSDLEPKTLAIINSSISPYLTNFNVTFNPRNLVRFTYPDLNQLQFILRNDVFKLFFFLDGNENSILNSNFYSKLSFFDSIRNDTLDYTLRLNRSQIINGTILHKFAVKKRIDDLSQLIKINPAEAQALKAEIVDLSVRFQVLSEYTSFIMIVKDNLGERVAPPLSIIIPSIASVDHLSSGFGISGTFTRGMHMAPRPSLDGATFAPMPSPPIIFPRNITITPSLDTKSKRNLTQLKKMIPNDFWENDKIILKTYDNSILYCDENMRVAYVIASNTSVNMDKFYWTPVLYSNTYILLKSPLNTYLGVDRSTKELSCKYTDINKSNMLHVTVKSMNKISLINYKTDYLITDKNQPLQSRYFYPSKYQIRPSFANLTATNRTDFDISGLEGSRR